MKPPVLGHFRGSHFNEKVRWALDYKGIPHVRRTLGASYLPRALWKTGRPTLPVLIVDGRGISDSARIIAELERMAPDPPLYPADATQRARALALETRLGDELGHPLRTMAVHKALDEAPEFMVSFFTLGLPPAARRAMRAIYPLMARFYRLRHGIDAGRAAAARETVAAGLDRLAEEVLPSGYLVGDAFSIADLTASALLMPFTAPAELEYALPGPYPVALAELQARLAAHPAGRYAVEIYRRHRGRSAELVA